jgi:energy-coupling factor transporter ATP-binding protein EcfA2
MMCCDGKDFIMIRVGHRGCGKSERARKLLGMTHEEYAKHGKFIEDLLEIERKHRELMEELSSEFASLMIGRLIVQTSEETQSDKSGVIIIDDAGKMLHDKKRR